MQWKEFQSHIRHLAAKDLQRVERAFELGKEVHKGQKRKSGEPYFNHPIAVADKLADMGADADTIIAALLHDTIEDTPLTLDDVEKEFGTTVAILINGVTKLSSEDVATKSSLDEQIETLRKIFILMQEDVRIMVIKLVDRLHNMQTVEFLSEARQKAQAQETMEVYVKIADRLCMQDLRDELEGLYLSILEPKTAQELSLLRAQNEQLGQSIIKKMQEKVRKERPPLRSQDGIRIQNVECAPNTAGEEWHGRNRRLSAHLCLCVSQYRSMLSGVGHPPSALVTGSPLVPGFHQCPNDQWIQGAPHNSDPGRRNPDPLQDPNTGHAYVRPQGHHDKVFR